MLDTNRVGDLIKRESQVGQVVAEADHVFLPFVVVAELHTGYRKGNRREKNEAELARFLREPGVQVLYADEETVDIWADLNASLLRGGVTLPHNDVWIAALAIQHRATVYSADQHFDRIEKVTRL